MCSKMIAFQLCIVHRYCMTHFVCIYFRYLIARLLCSSLRLRIWGGLSHLYLIYETSSEWTLATAQDEKKTSKTSGVWGEWEEMNPVQSSLTENISIHTTQRQRHIILIHYRGLFSVQQCLGCTYCWAVSSSLWRCVCHKLPESKMNGIESRMTNENFRVDRSI